MAPMFLHMDGIKTEADEQMMKMRMMEEINFNMYKGTSHSDTCFNRI